MGQYIAGKSSLERYRQANRDEDYVNFSACFPGFDNLFEVMVCYCRILHQPSDLRFRRILRSLEFFDSCFHRS